MEPNNEEKKKINDDLVVFLRKRSETDAPRYTARLKNYLDVQQKRRRAATARDHYHDKGKNTDGEPKSPKRTNELNLGIVMRRSRCGMSGEHPGSEDGRMSRGRRTEEKNVRSRSFSRSRSDAPSDRCGRRRRRRRRRRRCGHRRRRRRRSCRRRRRRRRSCRRRSRRRRRRSCSRRRRRRSCRRRRRRRRRC